MNRPGKKSDILEGRKERKDYTVLKLRARRKGYLTKDKLVKSLQTYAWRLKVVSRAPVLFLISGNQRKIERKSHACRSGACIEERASQ
eukprot:1145201-Pelagomonas_calceolata.AAC.4